MRIKQLIAGMAIALLCAVGLAACGDDDDGGASASSGAAGSKVDSDKPDVRLALIGIKIPGINLLEGQEAGAKAAVRKINADGGFGGREVVLDVCNSMAQPAVATTCARKTVAESPVAQFGCEVSWAATGLKAYAAKKIPSFNCVNSPEDFNDPWSFGVHPGAFGDDRAKARWACANEGIRKAVVVTQDIPQQHKEVPAAMGSVFKECGKQLEVVYYPLNAADLTPTVQKAVRQKPDFVFVNVSGPQVVPIVQGFEQAGLAGDKLGLGEAAWDYEAVVEPSGAALEGAYYFGGWKAWDDTSDSDMADYFAAMQAAGHDRDKARDPNAQYGFAEVMLFYAMAKEIGFDEFDSASLAEFAKTNNGLHIPLSRSMVNPGPKGFPQVKQPYAQVARWKGGKLTPVTEGTPEKGGWVSGF